MNCYVEPQVQLVTEIFVRDIQRSIAFYQGLGFQLEVERGQFAILSWDGCQLYQRAAAAWSRVPAANVRVMVADVDAIWERITGLGLEVFQPIADRPYVCGISPSSIQTGLACASVPGSQIVMAIDLGAAGLMR